MAKIEYHETPAGPHEFGDQTITITMTPEEYEWFTQNLDKEPVKFDKLAALMKEDGPWSG
jgi:hypothetical protein